MPSPGGLALPVVAATTSPPATTDDQYPYTSNSETVAFLTVPSGLGGLSTSKASDRFASAGFRNVRFVNRADGNVVVPSDIFTVTQVPAAGSLANPNREVVVYAAEKPPSYSLAEARAANAQVEQRSRAQQHELQACGIYGLRESEPNCIAAQEATKRAGGW